MPAQTEFKWVKSHDEESYGNERAGALPDTRREQNIPVVMDGEELIDRHPALQGPKCLLSYMSSSTV